MPKKTDSSSVETEKGFGTGLRTKLERSRPEPSDSAKAPAVEPVDAEPVADDTTELSETEQLWGELEESLAREEALKRQLDEQAAAYEEARELARRLSERADALQRREEELDVQFKALEEATAAARESADEPEHGRAGLRRRVEATGDALWKVFEEALGAKTPEGKPDHRLRLLAASALLAEAYGDGAKHATDEQVAAARDELAGKRAKRAVKPR